VAKAALLQPLEEREVGVIPAALIIGGGIAGIAAALDIANAGFKVYLVEKEPAIGGRMAQLNKTFPTLESCLELLSPRVQAVAEHPNIELLTSSEVMDIEGYIGNFQVKVRQKPREEIIEFDVGSIVVAIGYDHFDARLKPELGYGQYPNVITAPEFERLSSASGPTAGKITLNGKEPKNVVFIQCVGSRDETVGNKYCSRVCCMYTAKQAHLVKEKLPQASVTIFYMDVRTFGKGFEEFYDRVRREGVRYRRGSVSEIYKRGDKVAVRAEDTLLGEPLEMEADLVVLATGIVPRRDSQGIAELLKLPRSPDGFFAEAHPKLRPVETSTAGVFLAGCAQGPRDVPDTVAHAGAAALEAVGLFNRGEVTISPTVAVVDSVMCVGCGDCIPVCPYSAISRNGDGKAEINAALCLGCGTCVATCPAGAITALHFTDQEIVAQIDGLLALVG